MKLFKFTIISLLVSFNSILLGQNSINPIQFTSFDNKINLCVEADFKCEFKFPANDETIEIWNWKLFLHNPDSIYTLVSEDSIHNQNEITFSILLDTIPYPSFGSGYVVEDEYEWYSGIILVYGIDTNGKKHSIAKSVSIIGKFLDNDGCGCFFDFMYISSSVDTVYNGGKFFFSSIFFDDDQSGTTTEYWNWKTYLISPNGPYSLAKEDSVYGLNNCNWEFSIDNLEGDYFWSKDSNNTIFGYTAVNTYDNDGWLFNDCKMILFSSSITGLEKEEDAKRPYSLKLNQNYPNPFNPKTMINYQIPARSAGGAMTSYVELAIYNLLGQNVTTLVNKKQEAGSYSIQWDATGFASGVYIYILKTNKLSISKKMVLIR